MNLGGRVLAPLGRGESGRAVAVGSSGAVLTETPVTTDGRWTLEVAGQPELIVIQVKGRRLCAAAARPEEATEVRLPDTLPLRLSLGGILENVLVWIDPTELAGFPAATLPILRLHPLSVIDLHVGEYTPQDSVLDIEVQPGTYEISGGRFELRPTARGADRVQLAAVTDEASGRAIPVREGRAVVDVSAPASFELTFS